MPLRDDRGNIAMWYGTDTDIEDRMTAGQKLQRSEEELRRMIDAIPQMIVVLDPAGRAIDANQSTLDYTGLTLEAVRSQTFRKQVFHPDDLERLTGERQQALERGVSFALEQRARRMDGVYRWFLIQYNPFRDAQGRITRWYATGTDIDDRKQAEDRLHLMLDINKVLVAHLDLRNLFTALAASLRRVTDCRFIGLCLPDPATGQLRQHLVDYREGRGVITEGMVLPVFASAAGKAFRTRQLVWLERSSDGRPDPEIYGSSEGQKFYELLLKEGVPSGYFLPLIQRDHVIAVLQLTKYGNEPLKASEGEFLSALASQLSVAVANALEHGALVASREQLAREHEYLREEIDHSSMFEEIVGASAPLQRVLAKVARVADSDATVLIFGETGTGKELVARAIHKNSRRSSRAFISVNCAAVPAALIPSELFGHEKGAFTGAVQRRIGRFEAADGGTIFLDEVGELPPEAQVSLLRVLQERAFERVGSNRPITMDVRVLAATNRDLSRAVAQGKFREDLYYRLNVFPIEVPPLRDRADDIPLLIEYLVQRYAQKAGKKVTRIDRGTLELFRAYDWPGNVRELQNVIERSVILSDGEVFSVDEAWLRRHSNREPGSSTFPRHPDHEREEIEAALAESRGRVSGPFGAAVKLAIPRQTLESKIRALGINKYRFKAP